MSYYYTIGGDGHQARKLGRKIGPQAPPLTTTINKILQRYPEGSQILKVWYPILCSQLDKRVLSAKQGRGCMTTPTEPVKIPYEILNLWNLQWIKIPNFKW